MDGAAAAARARLASESSGTNFSARQHASHCPTCDATADRSSAARSPRANAARVSGFGHTATAISDTLQGRLILTGKMARKRPNLSGIGDSFRAPFGLRRTTQATPKPTLKARRLLRATARGRGTWRCRRRWGWCRVRPRLPRPSGRLTRTGRTSATCAPRSRA